MPSCFVCYLWHAHWLACDVWSIADSSKWLILMNSGETVQQTFSWSICSVESRCRLNSSSLCVSTPWSRRPRVSSAVCCRCVHEYISFSCTSDSQTHTSLIHPYTVSHNKRRSTFVILILKKNLFDFYNFYTAVSMKKVLYIHKKHVDLTKNNILNSLPWENKTAHQICL